MMEVVVSGTRQPVKFANWSLFRTLDNASDTGEPVYYTLFGTGFRLWPTPDTSYSLELSYIQALATLSASTDTNSWMTFGEELIRARAKADVFANRLADFEEASAMALIEQMALRRLRGRHTKRMASTRRIRGDVY